MADLEGSPYINTKYLYFDHLCVKYISVHGCCCQNIDHAKGSKNVVLTPQTTHTTTIHNNPQLTTELRSLTFAGVAIFYLHIKIQYLIDL